MKRDMSLSAIELNSIFSSSFSEKLYDIESCVSEINLHIERNMLKLNDEKIEFNVLKI